MCWSDFVLATEVIDFGEVRHTHCLTDKSLTFCLRQVGRDFACPLAGLQFLCKELLCGLEGICRFSLFLFCHEVTLRVFFLLDGFPFQHVIELADEQVGRSAVEDEVVDVHEQKYGALRFDDLEAV